MPPVNPKNSAISGVAMDLGMGLGDQLKQQTEDETANLKKKKEQAMAGQNPLGNVALDLGLTNSTTGGLG